jgi:serine O-acetyltransferase
MKLDKWLKDNSGDLSEQLCAINSADSVNNNCLNQTSKDAIIKVLNDVRSLIFPGIFEKQGLDKDNLLTITDSRFKRVSLEFYHIIENVLHEHCRYVCGKPDCNECSERASEYTIAIMRQMPAIRAKLEKDVEAAYEGDPAAKSYEEIILSYPAFQAISIFRIANAISAYDIPLIPRIMTEYAHEKTGIDIHPGATIGERFFIDHGTGVVIGETCTIGNNVKIYQSVTLGAKSFPVDENGNPIKDIKRHPDIRDNVIIYAGATILGGDTVIGENSVIGGNVWLTHGVEANTTVFNAQPSPILKPKK